MNKEKKLKIQYRLEKFKVLADHRNDVLGYLTEIDKKLNEMLLSWGKAEPEKTAEDNKKEVAKIDIQRFIPKEGI